MSYLFVLPFDHRGSFKKMLFPDAPELTDEHKQTITDYKWVIYNSLKIIGAKRGYDDMAILVDEEYGLDIHNDAKELGIRNLLTTEKSGEKVYNFQYEDWQDHILNIKPAYAKALTRVVKGDDNTLQNSRLKELNDFCSANDIGFLIEPLIQPRDEDLAAVDGDKERYDAEIRPTQFAEAVAEMHAAGVTPDVWKIEGTETKEGMDICSEAVFNGGKPDAQIVILGRGASTEKVDHWLKMGANSQGVNGFAVGRTVFADPIEKLHAGELSKEEATQIIADNYDHFIDTFLEARG